MTTFETASIGDEVWCITMGRGTIADIRLRSEYPICVEFDSERKRTFTIEGREYSDDSNQTLFWGEVKIEAPTKPLPKLNKDDYVEVWNRNSDNPAITFKRHFSHFHLGRIYCFENGRTSWTSTETIGWNRWRKPI